MARENTVFIDPQYCSKKFDFGAIHHELKHAKKEELYEMLACQNKITDLLKNNFAADSKGFKTLEEDINANWTKEFQDEFLTEHKYLFRNNFPLLKDYKLEKLGLIRAI